eukprot:TRINITY_DN4889_c0_g1_i1.p1 TRINITY_DN4889_c0_g1~~TRINITY_DN4889_c0_g1_i1.p1  ORF type:complete len:259 (-),score=27.51 TRINITY_DN4889_c0_g1_i1:196-909(-)
MELYEAWEALGSAPYEQIQETLVKNHLPASSVSNDQALKQVQLRRKFWQEFYTRALHTCVENLPGELCSLVVEYTLSPYHTGDRIEVLDIFYLWYTGRVVDTRFSNELTDTMGFLQPRDAPAEGFDILVQFDGWSSNFNEWIRLPSARVAPLNTHPNCGGSETRGVPVNPLIDVEVERIRNQPYVPAPASVPPRNDGEIFMQLVQRGYSEEQALRALTYPGGIDDLSERLRYEQFSV